MVGLVWLALVWLGLVCFALVWFGVLCLFACLIACFLICLSTCLLVCFGWFALLLFSLIVSLSYCFFAFLLILCVFVVLVFVSVCVCASVTANACVSVCCMGGLRARVALRAYVRSCVAYVCFSLYVCVCVCGTAQLGRESFSQTWTILNCLSRAGGSGPLMSPLPMKLLMSWEDIRSDHPEEIAVMLERCISFQLAASTI